MIPVNKHGEFGQNLSSIDLNTYLTFSYQCLGERLSIHYFFFNIRYVLFGVIGQL